MISTCLRSAAPASRRLLLPALAPRSRAFNTSRAVSMAAAKRVPAIEAAELCEAGAPYLDVRTPEEFAAGHPPSAVNIPLMFKAPEGMVPNPEFIEQVKQQFPDTTAEIVVGCKAGNRSARACAALMEYSNLVDQAGGWDGWVAANLPTSK